MKEITLFYTNKQLGRNKEDLPKSLIYFFFHRFLLKAVQQTDEDNEIPANHPLLIYILQRHLQQQLLI